MTAQDLWSVWLTDGSLPVLPRPWRWAADAAVCAHTETIDVDGGNGEITVQYDSRFCGAAYIPDEVIDAVRVVRDRWLAAGVSL